jgi:hypothetical protein
VVIALPDFSVDEQDAGGLLSSVWAACVEIPLSTSENVASHPSTFQFLGLRLGGRNPFFWRDGDRLCGTFLVHDGSSASLSIAREFAQAMAELLGAGSHNFEARLAHLS